MGVRHVRVIVHEMGMMVLVAVRFCRRVSRAMSMSMVLVVHVQVRVGDWLVRVRV